MASSWRILSLHHGSCVQSVVVGADKQSRTVGSSLLVPLSMSWNGVGVRGTAESDTKLPSGGVQRFHMKEKGMLQSELFTTTCKLAAAGEYDAVFDDALKEFWALPFFMHFRCKSVVEFSFRELPESILKMKNIYFTCKSFCMRQVDPDLRIGTNNNSRRLSTIQFGCR